MALTQQVATVIDKLLVLSHEDKVVWQETADENTFLAALPKFVITIAMGSERVAPFDPNEIYFLPYYQVRVLDQSGKILEEASISKTDPYFKESSELHELARRRALQVDAQLSELLSSLDRI